MLPPNSTTADDLLKILNKTKDKPSPFINKKVVALLDDKYWFGKVLSHTETQVILQNARLCFDKPSAVLAAIHGPKLETRLSAALQTISTPYISLLQCSDEAIICFENHPIP